MLGARKGERGRDEVPVPRRLQCRRSAADRDEPELEELELLDEDELEDELLELEEWLLDEDELDELEGELDDELEDELVLLELEEDPLDELELDGDELEGDELEDDDDGPVGESAVPQASSMPTPASATLPERILRNSRRSPRRVASSLGSGDRLSAMV